MIYNIKKDSVFFDPLRASNFYAIASKLDLITARVVQFLLRLRSEGIELN